MAVRRSNRRGGLYGLPKWRRWSRNRLGPGSAEKPEKMSNLTYTLPNADNGLDRRIPERHRQISAIEDKAKEILKSRESDTVSFLRGESGAYYVKLTNRHETGAVFFKITNPEILEKVKQELIVERRLRQKGLPKKRNWAENKLGVASAKKSEQTNFLSYVLPGPVGEQVAKLIEIRELDTHVRKLLKARLGDTVVFLKGKKSENYYAKLTNRVGTGIIFFKITNPEILAEIKRIYI
jgi:hypothetical protein